MKTKLLLSLFLLFQLNTFSQSGIQWQKCLGGSLGEALYAIRQTTDGGYIVAGNANSTDGDVSGNHGNSDYWIVKLSNTGYIQWQKCLGGSELEGASDIQQTTDGGYIVAGGSNSTGGDITGNHGASDCWIVKLDSAGNIQWEKSLGGSGEDVASAIQQTTDGGYIVAASSNSTNGNVTGNHGKDDYWIVKLDSIGNIQWQKSLGGSRYDDASTIQKTADGGYIVTGFSESIDGDITGHHGSSLYIDYWIVKLDSIGNIQWQKSLGGSNQDASGIIQQTTDGGYIIAGWSRSNDGDVTGHHGSISYPDYWIVKLSSAGNMQWQKSLGGSGDDIPGDIQQTIDGGYIVAGRSDSTDGDVLGIHGEEDYWILKLDGTGNIQWQKSLGGSYSDYAYAIQLSTDGGYIIAGGTRSIDGDVIGNNGSLDGWIVKLSPNVGIDELSTSENLFSIYPNPSTNQFTISFNPALSGTISNASLKIFNLMGEEVYEQTVNSKLETVNTKLSSGVYFVKMRAGEKEWVEKLMVE